MLIEGLQLTCVGIYFHILFVELLGWLVIHFTLCLLKTKLVLGNFRLINESDAPAIKG